MRYVSLLMALAIVGAAAITFAAPARASEAWASGSLEKVDQSSNTVVIKQGAHEMTFSIGAGARLMRGRSTVQASDLTSDVGHHVKVRYTKNGSILTADRIEVSAPAQQAKASPGQAKPGNKKG